MALHKQPVALILDDDQDTLAVMAEWLGELCLDVFAFIRPEDLMQSLPDTAADLIVLDLNMPGVDGFDVLAQLAALKFRAPIVIYSAMSADVVHAAGTLANFRNLNVVAWLPKSIAFDRFAEIVNASVLRDAETVDVTDRARIDFVYQPIVAADTLDVVAVEALVRFDGKAPTPDHISALEIGPQRQAFWEISVEHTFADWQSWGRESLRLSLNVSARLLTSSGFYEDLIARLKAHAMPPSALTLELTERAGVVRPMEVVRTICRLRMIGVHMALDDFGSRLSTVERLRTLPFTDVKLDGKLLADAPIDCANSTITAERAMLLANGLQLTTTAETVETSEDLARARTLGVDLVQGYGISKPLPADAVAAYCAPKNL